MTWRAKHFGVTQQLTSKITRFAYPYHFRDEMLEGAFKMIRHDHIFEKAGDKTVMKDMFEFDSPGGVFGAMFNKLVLIKYLRGLLVKRNKMIKEIAEGNQWKTILNS